MNVTIEMYERGHVLHRGLRVFIYFRSRFGVSTAAKEWQASVTSARSSSTDVKNSYRWQLQRACITTGKPHVRKLHRRGWMQKEV